MPHQTHLNTVERIRETGWGRQFDDPRDAEKALLESPIFAGFAVLSVGNQIEQIIDDFTRARLKRVLAKMRVAVNAELNKRIATLVEIHGEIPSGVYEWIVREFYEGLGRSVWQFDSEYWTPGHIRYHSRPPKGSDLRREYDAYMRRKPPKGATK